MNTEWWIARRISLGAQQSFSRIIVSIAILATVLSTSVMVIAICMVNGFTTQIEEKVFGFWGHIQIKHFQNNRSYEEYPITENAKMLAAVKKNPEVQAIHPYITKAGIIRTKNALEGIVLKGVDQRYDFAFLQRFLKEGKVPEFKKDSLSRDILISASTARRLKAKLGDKMVVYFVDPSAGQPIGKSFFITGIYHTGLEEYDIRFAIMDLHVLQDVSHWEPNQVGGYEILLNDVKNADNVAAELYDNVLSNELDAETIRKVQPNIFDWLELQVRTEFFALILMLLVAIMNMISALLILIIDRTKMIGILKSLGYNNLKIRKIFLLNALVILCFGLIGGNILGLAICVLQDQTGFITLDESSYYFATAPVAFPWGQIVAVNIATIIINLMFLLIPSALIARISPLKAIRFD